MTFTTRPELIGTHGMVSTTHWIATAVGQAVLEAGGNAFDAATASGFCLQVVEPHQNGPGGDLPVLFARPGDVTPTVLCAQGPAPMAATAAAFADLGFDLVPGSGLLAAVVPGATAGWLTLLRDHGTMGLRDVLGYSIGYARAGYPVVPAMSACIEGVADLFRNHWTTSAATYLPGGHPPAPGTLFRNEALARTYEQLVHSAEASDSREAGIDAAITAWSEGFVAAQVDTFMRSSWLDASGEPHAGLLTGSDLARWRPWYEQPLGLGFRGHTVYKPGAWSQGPVLLQQLALLDGFDLDPGTADTVHLVVECAKLAFADREAWYGDTTDAPLAALLSADYATMRRRLVGDAASYDLRPGSPDGREPRLPRLVTAPPAVRLTDAAAGEPNAATTDDSRPDAAARTDTVHVDVVDRWGTMVSAMPSGGWLQSSPVIPELGFGLGTRLQMTWLEQGLASSLTPGRRPRTTLSPTMVMRGDQPVLAFGSPGGDQQDQWQLGLVLEHLVAGHDLQRSIDAPAFHTASFPSSFYPRESEPGVVVVEDRLGADVVAALEARGHRVRRTGGWSLGRLCAVRRDTSRGTLHAAANPRGMQAYAAGR
ncbi:MAG: Gamma-glutamyltransferase [Nocardioidaceae bacterium]|jgi:gamma-glutamyltranspeptidase/glutathione hydrolase|nr:Gamma-glutamyltransferase [Nocardioidaceae bacterium]